MTMAHYIEQIHLALPLLIGNDVPSLNSLRQNAAVRFAEIQFPTTKQENWKYTNLELLAAINFEIVCATTPASISEQLMQQLASLPPHTHRLVFIDGVFSEALSLLNDIPAAISCTHWHPALHTPQMAARFEKATNEIDGIAALNLALMQDGAVINIPTDTCLAQPIHMVYLHTSASVDKMSHLHNWVELGDNAEMTFIEHHIGEQQRYFSTTLTTINMQKNAKLYYLRSQEHGDAAYHISRLHLTQAENSQAALFAMDMGGHLVRNDILQFFEGEHARCDLAGLYLLGDKQHTDNHLSIHHTQPHCNSNQFYKGILDDRSHGVFQGKVTVYTAAQKTDAQQHNANLLLSDNAIIDTQPQLEIYADDVKCSHGATVGQLDEDAVFYLQSRGIDAATARDLLIYGFAAELLGHIKQDNLRHFCRLRLLAALPHALTMLQEEVT